MSGKQIDSIGSIVATTLMAAAGAIIFLLLPVIVGAAVDSFQFNEEQAGFLASSYFVGYLLVCVAAVLWIRRIGPRTLAGVSYLIFAVGLVAAAFAQQLYLLVAAMLVSGAGAGMLLGLAVTLIGDSQHKDRNFGLMLVVQQLFAALMLFVLPDYVIAAAGFSGLMLVLAAIIAMGLLTLPWLPAISAQDSGRHQGVSNPGGLVGGGAWMIWLGLLAMAVYFAALSGVWAFVERMAVDRALTSSEIGVGLGISMLGGVLGGLLVALQGDRLGRLIPLLASSLVIATILFCYSREFTFLVFTVVTFMFSLSWNYVLGYQMAIVSDLDNAGRYSVLIPAAQALGAVVGPMLAGLTMVGQGYSGVLSSSAAGIAVALVLFVMLASRKSNISGANEFLSEGE